MDPRPRQAKPKIIVQPVIIEQQVPQQQNEPPPKPRKKKQKKKHKHHNQTEDFPVMVDTISDDEFDKIEAPQTADGSRVEMKEKTFPDGRRQVEEITHHPDGSYTTKLMMYDE